MNLSAAAQNPPPPTWYETLLTWFWDVGLSIILIIVFALILRWVIFRIIRRVTAQAVEKAAQERPGLTRDPEHTTDLTRMLMQQRREQRATSIGQLLRSITTVTIFGITVLLVLTTLGLNIGPLIASAGVIGVALGFGAQTLVKDFLSGIFLVTEDQFGVGDDVDLGPASGKVEEVGLRITRVRDDQGIVWYVRNGEILRVGNHSQGWTLATVDIAVAYDENLDKVRHLIEEVADDMYGDDQYDGMLFGKPKYVGVDRITGDTVYLRITARTSPGQGSAVTRAIVGRVKTTFDRAGIRVPAVAQPSAIDPPNPPATPRTPRV